ncbi:peptidoglycan-binding domain-containing protein [Falsiroseomonas tokyonensis]|uniref:Peptidoglycan-binding protein n=1 Tax=Falsiroseomonas tokyonensis TaxID=430521 RepID=A0ABV7C1Q8_9PROT|nr:peptidoglycan-binding protein [Falsiroseomonas tokyonensis]MBU8540061.1 peptidoglycan-binding protein [Falsiroseomonas tokyonensis]
MRTTSLCLGALLGAHLLLAPAASQAQSPAPLTYAQPLAPEAVTRVQEKLREAGAYSGRPDGVWGPSSQAALERFQQNRGLQATGQLNQATATLLGLNPAELVATGPGAVSAPAPAAAQTQVLSEAAVRNVQGRLRALGFYRGEQDGIWGPSTQAAIERFQQGAGLQATGQLTPVTAAALGLDPNNLAAPPR